MDQDGRVPTLIHLNGPSGVGKSTLAQLYVDEHPGALNLDIDRVVALIGGWEDNFAGTLAPARRIATAMAETHLASGNDVVMPQLVTSLEEIQRFEAAAARAGGGYREIALLVDPLEQIRRFRAKSNRSHLERHIQRSVYSNGGDALLARIHRHFSEYLAKRPDAYHVCTDGLDPVASYDLLSSALL